MRPFAYFSGEGKVGRGTGPEAPKQPKDLRFAAEASWCVLCVF